jgi:hypothetical protein
MPALKINPHAKTVETWEPQGPWLDALREVIGCLQVDSVMVQDHICLWFDNLGLLKTKDQRYWRFSDNDHRFAGISILTAVDKDGMPSSLTVPPGDLKAGIDWCEGDEPDRVFEELVVTPTEFGPWPRVTRKVLWRVREPVFTEATPVAPVAWTLWDDDITDGFKLLGPLGDEKIFDSLKDAQGFAQDLGLVEHLREPGDAEGLVATYLPR